MCYWWLSLTFLAQSVVLPKRLLPELDPKKAAVVELKSVPPGEPGIDLHEAFKPSRIGGTGLDNRGEMLQAAHWC